jgi:hypothetical protein
MNLAKNSKNIHTQRKQHIYAEKTTYIRRETTYIRRKTTYIRREATNIRRESNAEKRTNKFRENNAEKTTQGKQLRENNKHMQRKHF